MTKLSSQTSITREDIGVAGRQGTKARHQRARRQDFDEHVLEGVVRGGRCLVPASSYCEPNGEKPAVWIWFALKGSSERPLFAFPGVWRSYSGPIKKDGPTVSQEVYAFMTTAPNELTASISHERMPVLLSTDEQCETWLKGSTQEALALARSFPAEAMRIVQFGADKIDLVAA